MIPRRDRTDDANAARLGAEEAAKELGLDLAFEGPTSDKVEQQIALVQRAIDEGSAAIVVSAMDPFVIAPALSRAKTKGLSVVTWSADASPKGSKRDAFVIPAPADEIAAALVDVMARGIGGAGKVVIIGTTSRSPEQNTYLAEIRAILDVKHPKITVVDTVHAGEDLEGARKMGRDVLKAHGDAKGIWTLSAEVTKGVAEAIGEVEPAKRPFLTGIGLPDGLRAHVANGVITRFVGWNPVDLGYLAVQTARGLSKSALSSGARDFGRLKGVRVESDEVILGRPLIFDKSNIDNYHF